MNGYSMIWAPAHVNKIKLFIYIQYISWFMGYGFNEFNLELIRGIKYKIIIDERRAITPPSLLGIDRKMA